jgi:DNA-binding response OmpR family regulator
VTAQHRFRRPGAIPAARYGGALAVDEKVRVALVVDDEPLARHFVSAVLRRQGWSVLEAAGAAAALAMANVDPPDLLVTDYEMPDISGVDLARQLRRLDEDLPVLVISGYADAPGSMRGLDGRTAFARKPFAIEELLSTICSIVD